jgi:aerobic-type carbon monoxide dehydrogenase small subunit (CoxS/CutS family)
VDAHDRHQDDFLNGEPVSAAIAPHHTLLEVVHNAFSLYGERESCGNLPSVALCNSSSSG